MKVNIRKLFSLPFFFLFLVISGTKHGLNVWNINCAFHQWPSIISLGHFSPYQVSLWVDLVMRFNKPKTQAQGRPKQLRPLIKKYKAQWLPFGPPPSYIAHHNRLNSFSAYIRVLIQSMEIDSMNFDKKKLHVHCSGLQWRSGSLLDN